MLQQEHQRKEDILAGARDQNILKLGIPVKALDNSLDSLYLDNLRHYLFGRSSLDYFLKQTRFGFWLLLEGGAQEKKREKFFKNAEMESLLLSQLAEKKGHWAFKESPVYRSMLYILFIEL